MEKINSITGIKDILPEDAPTWNHIESIARQVFGSFGFREIRVPIMEKAELFKRSIGETTDIVEKEMYTFRDRDDELLTLRPEATASIIRAYIEHNMHSFDQITKLYTMGPMFRRERPQKGRFRQFHQIDVFSCWSIFCSRRQLQNYPWKLILSAVRLAGRFLHKLSSII